MEGIKKVTDLTVKEIAYEETKDMIMNLHYAQRMPSISYSFGLFNGEELIGVCTFGKPASNQLTEGVCGKEFKSKVFELNRLILKDGTPRNTASYFVSRCLNKLKKDNLIIVSYSDTGMNHNGYVYQACNFIFTGRTKQRTDKFSGVGKHSRHYLKEEKEIYRKIRTAKNRYVYFCANKVEKKKYMKNLKYDILPYPKEENKMYKLGEKQENLLKIVDTGKIIKESDLE